MTLVLIPLPTDALEGSQGYWRPYVIGIAERSGNDVMEMERMLYSGEAQAFLIWDPEQQAAKAFLGVSYKRNRLGRIAELIWLTGTDRKLWIGLFDELKTYLRDHQHCILIRPICRPGWRDLLKPMGFRITHYVMEAPL